VFLAVVIAYFGKIALIFVIARNVPLTAQSLAPAVKSTGEFKFSNHLQTAFVS